MMNQLIMTVSKLGLQVQAQMLCTLGGSVCLISCAFWYGRKMHLSVKQIVLILLIAYPCLLGVMQLTFMAEIYAASKQILGITSPWQSGVKMCVFLPLMSWLISRILKIRYELMADLLAVIRLIEYPISTLGCIFQGCCTGYPCDWGLYNPSTGTYDFPIQPLNSLVMCIIVVYLLYRAKKNNYVPDGKQLPLMLLLMGFTRYLAEFVMNREKPILGTTTVGAYGIIMTITGIVMLVRAKRKEYK